jgi:ABC-2 type transport system permease protein
MRRASPVWAQAGFDLRLVMRNGEQVLLTVLIPVALLIGVTLIGAVPLTAPPGSARAAEALGGVISVAIISSAFTSLAITLGFDRRSGALLMWATTPLSRVGILTARILATSAVVALQCVLLMITAIALGWRPIAATLALPLVAVLGTAAFAALGFALGGTVRAEATLAIANAVFLVLLVAGGTTFPASELPAPLAQIVSMLPSSGLADLLRWSTGGGPVATSLASLSLDAIIVTAWGVGAAVVAARSFRWR